MTLESGLLLLLVAVVAVAFYCIQRTLMEILRTLRLNAKVKALNAAFFLKPEGGLEQQNEEPLRQQDRANKSSRPQ